MDYDYDNIDFDELRRDLMDYFGTATPMFPMAFMDVIDVENASEDKLIQIALDNGFDLDNYITKYR